MSLKLNIQHQGGTADTLLYDPYRLTLKTGDGTDVIPKVYSDDWENSLQSARSSIRLVLGKNCNMRCKYCSQNPTKPHGDYLREARNDSGVLHKTLDMILSVGETRGIHNIVLWGGEPLLYFKQMKYIVEYLTKRDSRFTFSTLSNGTLLTEEIVDFLVDYNVTVTLSHDGPNHSLLRGKNLLEDPKLLPLVRRLAKELPNFCFNSVIHKHNADHMKLFGYLSGMIGRPVDLAVVDPLILLFDEAAEYLIPDEELPAYTANFFRNFYQHSDVFFNHFRYYKSNVINFIDALRGASHVPENMHCRTILNGVFAVDLYGNVITCQNEDPFSKTKYGDPHLKGSIFAIDELKSPRVDTWRQRETSCQTCPVLFLCRNKCPHTPDNLHMAACKQYFHHYVVLLAAAIALITEGAVLTGIEGDFFHSKSLAGGLC